VISSTSRVAGSGCASVRAISSANGTSMRRNVSRNSVSLSPKCQNTAERETRARPAIAEMLVPS
jgi:hypothetical protein